VITLTNREIRFAYNRIEMVEGKGLPIKVSYALTRTKNKYLESDFKSFREETQDLDPDSEEFERHLNHEIKTDVHQVSASHLRDASVEPSTFVGLTFLFPERESLDTAEQELKNRDIVGAVNVLQRWGGQRLDDPATILQISNALTAFRVEVVPLKDRLSAVEDEEEREELLQEKTALTVSEISMEALVQNDGFEVAPKEIELVSPFLTDQEL
jgi:hypothetical protein